MDAQTRVSYDGRVDAAVPGQQAVTLTERTGERDVKTLDASLDFDPGGNVLITIQLQTLAPSTTQDDLLMAAPT